MSTLYLLVALALLGSFSISEEICDCEEKPKCPKMTVTECPGGRGMLMVPGGPDCSCCEAVCPRRKGERCDEHRLSCEHGLSCNDAGICGEDTNAVELTAIAASNDTLTLGWRGPPGYEVQYREVSEGKSEGQWQKYVKLTESPESNITLHNLSPGITYEARAFPPGAENDGPSAAVRAETGCNCDRPFFKIGSFKEDKYCTERAMPHKPCCALVMCADSQPEDEPSEGHLRSEASEISMTAIPMNKTCMYKNKTHSMGEEFFDGCEHKCTCGEDEKVTCVPRCEEVSHNISSKCVSFPDPKDNCCTMVLCDVTLGDQEATSTQGDADKKSSDGSTTTSSPSLQQSEGAGVCTYNGKSYAAEEEFHDGCKSLCYCSSSGEVECAPIVCPTESGLDVLDPHCIDWETVPNDPSELEGPMPTCCPRVRCRSNGSCEYGGERYDNYAELPASVSENCSSNRCFCEFGNVTCGGGGTSKCPQIPPQAPSTLDCKNGGPGAAILAHPASDTCCLAWMCPEGQPSTTIQPSTQSPETDFGRPPPPPRFPEVPIHPQLHPPLHNVGVGSPSDEIMVEAADVMPDSSLHLIFSLPSIFVGLHGQVEISYTEDPLKEDTETWEGKEIVSTPGDLIESRRLEYTIPGYNGKNGLQPNKNYRIQIALLLNGLRNTPTSRIIKIRTPPRQEATTQLPPQIEIDVELGIAEVNATWARFVWRKFNDFELQFIDGVQLRYKEVEVKVYSTTQLLHRATGSYTLEGLKPSSNYEIGLLLVPFPGQKTELISRETLHITTAAEKDPYGFDLKIKVDAVKATSAEVSWSGVPYPEDKYVNIFRVIYQSDSANTKGGEGSDGADGEERSSTFKVAKRDPSPSALVKNLKPGTRYRMWLEAYLTNGKIKKSDVKDIVTKPSSSASTTKQGKLEASAGEVGKSSTEPGDYYGGLVGVSILAALAIVAILILLLMLLKRQGQAKKAAISTARKSESAYDNPTYKTSDHDSTNGRIKNSVRLQEA